MESPEIMSTNNRLSIVALIPARAGSKRIPGKNTRRLNGNPLIAYTIAAARESELFSGIIVSTDAAATAEIAEKYGAEVPFLRPVEYASDQSPDIEWVRYTLEELKKADRSWDYFSILRPTSPFRKASTIRSAFASLLADPQAESLRAVEKCGQHPYKMWLVENGLLKPLFPAEKTGVPCHSQPYQNLPDIFTQNASLEIARTSTVCEKESISGEKILPFFTDGYEGFDINTPDDWVIAEHLVEENPDLLPNIPGGGSLDRQESP